MGTERHIQRAIGAGRSLGDVQQVCAVQRSICRAAHDDRIIFARRQTGKACMGNAAILRHAAADGNGVGGIGQNFGHSVRTQLFGRCGQGAQLVIAGGFGFGACLGQEGIGRIRLLG